MPTITIQRFADTPIWLAWDNGTRKLFAKSVDRDWLIKHCQAAGYVVIPGWKRETL